MQLIILGLLVVIGAVYLYMTIYHLPKRNGDFDYAVVSEDMSTLFERNIRTFDQALAHKHRIEKETKFKTMILFMSSVDRMKKRGDLTVTLHI